MQPQRFKFKKDRYRANRGGNSQFLNIYCEHCGEHILLYQKDGPGPLKRMYMDRIIAPEKLTDLQKKEKQSDLTCDNCKRLIAIPAIYKKEKRNSYQLLAYVIIKKRTKGVYPPEIGNML